MGRGGETGILARTDSQGSWQDIAQMYSQRGSDGKRASFGQDIREMYSPTLFFTAFRRLKHT